MDLQGVFGGIGESRREMPDVLPGVGGGINPQKMSADGGTGGIGCRVDVSAERNVGDSGRNQVWVLPKRIGEIGGGF